MVEQVINKVREPPNPKKIYRAALELSHQCDNVLKSTQILDETNKFSFPELFSPDNAAIRDKLRTYAERLIIPSSQFSRKGEDLIWKKVFYDVITSCRATKAHLSSPAKLPYRAHLMSAVGYYQHLLLKLQQQYHLNLCGVVDFAHDFSSSDTQVPDAILEEGISAVHRCLLYLGDLARYQAETEGINYKSISARFYHQALLICPKEGRPHNQLGTLAGINYEGLEAAYHYMKCLSSKIPFPGAGDNLKGIFNKTVSVSKDVMCSPESYPPTRRFLICFLLLADKLSGPVSMSEVDQLVRGLGGDFADCYTDNRQPFPPALVLKIVTMAIMLAENALAPGVDTVQPKLIPALVIELMTTILTVTIQQLGEKLSSPDNQFQSLQISGNVEEERSVVMLHVISTQSLLLPLKILGDWIKARHQLIAQDLTGTFWAQFGDLLNLFPHTRDLERIVKEGFSQSQQQQKIALPEDVALRGLAPLSTLHSQLEFPPMSPDLNLLDEFALRLLCLKSVGQFAAQLRPRPGLQYDLNSDLYSSLLAKPQVRSMITDRERTMKAMAHRRLQSEIKGLEYSVSANQYDSLSPFLVPVTSTVCLHLRTVKLLVATQRSVIIIPKQVIQDLDSLKKSRENHYARDAIKYFESMFKNGNWWLRGQGDQEFMSVKEPAPSPEMAGFLSVLSCCLYLANKSQGIVTLLVPDDAVSAAKNHKNCNAPNNYTGSLPSGELMELAKRYGIRVEGALEFYSKWTMSNRHGKIGRGK